MNRVGFQRLVGRVCLAAAFFMLAPLPRLSWGAIDEIVVTTRKKEENLQDVPIAVTAIGADQIERQGITDLADVAKLSPSVQFDTAFGPQDNRITIRGLSNTRGRSNVAFLVDGIDVTTENVITAGSGLLANRRLLNDVERIEVVKGPQSALYGRSAFAGAISYVTKDPGNEFEGQVHADLAEFGHQELSGAVGGPVGDILGLRANGVYWSDDGFYQNSISGDPVGAGHGFGGSLIGVLKPRDGVKIKGRVEYSHDWYSPTANVRITGNQYRPYPHQALQDTIVHDDNTGNDVNIGKVGQPSPSLQFTTYLPYFGKYCSGIYDQRAQYKYQVSGNYNGQPGPGFCLPSTFGHVGDNQVQLSEQPGSSPLDANGNPTTGGSDFPGTDARVMRGSVVASWDTYIGTVSSWTGYTYARNNQYYDQDYQASGFPDTVFPQLANQNGQPLGSLNKSYAAQWNNSSQTTDQLSQELRFASSWEGPLQATVGGLYWHERRELLDNNVIIDCLPTQAVGLTGTIASNPSPCQANSWQEVAQELTQYRAAFEQANGALECKDYVNPANSQTICGSYTGHAYTGTPWNTETTSLSAYLSLDYKFSDEWSVTLEDRYIHEKFYILKPNQAPCTPLGFTLSTLPSLASGTPLYCASVNTLINGYNPDVSGSTNFRLLEGTTFSHFNTPKVTLNWKVAPDDLLYFSWALAEKPGGINQLSAGGCCIDAGVLPGQDPLAGERYDPEKMFAYELGAKTSWQVAGSLQWNTALFFEDYTDKQVTVQEIVNGRLAPRVVNASGAQVWGGELELTWQPGFLEGLTLSTAYTYLDATYTDFIQDSQNLVRLASEGACPKIITKADVVTGVLKPFCELDLSGHSLERTPKNSFLGGISLRRPFRDGGFDYLTELSGQYQGTRYLDEDNFVRFNPYWLLDLRVGLIAKKWDVIAYVSNLLDDNTIKTGGSGPDFGSQAANLGFTSGLGVNEYFGTLPDPRVVGVRTTYKF